jgi:hypothetical protein
MALDYLENIGRAKTLFEAGATSPMQTVLKNFAELQIQLSRDALQKGSPRHWATGSLAQSLSFKINFDEKVSLDFIMNDYWDYINAGVQGMQGGAQVYQNAFGTEYSFKTLSPSRGMIDSFVGTGDMDGWMRAKNITSLSWTDEDGVEQIQDLVTDEDFRSAAFVFARGVKKRGIDGNLWIDNVFNEKALERFENELIKAIEKEL